MKLPRRQRVHEGARPSLRPIPALRWTLIALAAFLAVSFGITLWLLAIAGSAKPGTDRANARLDAVRTGLAAGAGAGAAVGLILAFRRQYTRKSPATRPIMTRPSGASPSCIPRQSSSSAARRRRSGWAACTRWNAWPRTTRNIARPSSTSSVLTCGCRSPPGHRPRLESLPIALKRPPWRAALTLGIKRGRCG
jgi:hypothetical protein